LLETEWGLSCCSTVELSALAQGVGAVQGGWPHQTRSDQTARCLLPACCLLHAACYSLPAPLLAACCHWKPNQCLQLTSVTHLNLACQCCCCCCCCCATRHINIRRAARCRSRLAIKAAPWPRSPQDTTAALRRLACGAVEPCPGGVRGVGRGGGADDPPSAVRARGGESGAGGAGGGGFGPRGRPGRHALKTGRSGQV
jgi:hypothetical protein